MLHQPLPADTRRELRIRERAQADSSREWRTRPQLKFPEKIRD